MKFLRRLMLPTPVPRDVDDLDERLAESEATRQRLEDVIARRREEISGAFSFLERPSR